jgi:hypothetical protein
MLIIPKQQESKLNKVCKIISNGSVENSFVDEQFDLKLKEKSPPQKRPKQTQQQKSIITKNPKKSFG